MLWYDEHNSSWQSSDEDTEESELIQGNLIRDWMRRKVPELFETIPGNEDEENPYLGVLD